MSVLWNETVKIYLETQSPASRDRVYRKFSMRAKEL
jgi:hypothetical protein